MKSRVGDQEEGVAEGTLHIPVTGGGTRRLPVDDASQGYQGVMLTATAQEQRPMIGDGARDAIAVPPREVLVSRNTLACWWNHPTATPE